MAMNGAVLPVPPPYLPTTSHYAYLNEAEYNALKRTYLSLLPLPQIIDICLIFEAYVPLHVRGSVWPYDLKASIATFVTKSSPSTSTPEATQKEPTQPSTSNSPTNHEPPPIAPLQDLVSKPSDTPDAVQPQNSATKSPAPPAASTSERAQITHQPQHAPYYPYSPHVQQPSYQHVPYSSTAPHPNVPYYPYPAYAQQNPSLNPYTHPSVPPPPPNFNPGPFTRPPLTRADGTPAEDLPSYEEMIVEALTECADPEGAAPKDLFSWMAARYPLQTNFRPSASQALQKAFKRGRLEKRTSGKYILNVNWEGGRTSRRTTRRPQTQAMMQQNMPQASPFTTASLGNQPYEQASTPGQPLLPPYSGAPYAYQYPGYDQQKPLVESSSSAREDVGEGSDAWEAAQNILKAINFGELLPQEKHSEDPPESSIPPDPPEIRVCVGTSTATEPVAELGDQDDGNGDQEPSEIDRAGLQAELALLAAQLAELGECIAAESVTENVVVDTSPVTVESLRSSKT